MNIAKLPEPIRGSPRMVLPCPTLSGKSTPTSKWVTLAKCSFAAELTLAGIPALKVPDLWPGYDVIAQPVGKDTQRISVKSRTFKTGAAYVEYNIDDPFDWLAIVLLSCGGDKPRRIFVVPRAVADRKARRDSPTAKTAKLRYWRIDELADVFGNYEDNFTLSAG